MHKAAGPTKRQTSMTTIRGSSDPGQSRPRSAGNQKTAVQVFANQGQPIGAAASRPRAAR
eukprot:7229549-Pyramimonas_sp.AAC.1